MSLIHHGPYNRGELREAQRPKADRLLAAGWVPRVLGFLTGSLYLEHPNGRACALHRDGSIEAIDLADEGAAT